MKVHDKWLKIALAPVGAVVFIAGCLAVITALYGYLNALAHATGSDVVTAVIVAVFGALYLFIGHGVAGEGLDRWRKWRSA